MFALYIQRCNVVKWRMMPHSSNFSSSIWLKTNLLWIYRYQLWPQIHDAFRTSSFFMWVYSNVFWNIPKFALCLSTFPMVLNILLTCSNFVPCLRIVCCFHNQIIWTWNPSWFHWTSSFSIFYELSENVAEICREDTEELLVSVKAVSKLISLSRLFVCVF